MSSERANRILLGAILLVAPALVAQQLPGVVNLSPNREGYAGDEACRTCHSEKLENYFHTAHHLTSRLPTKDSIAGSFASGKNILKTSNAGLYFHMESKPDGFYQTSMSAFPPVAPIRSE